ncbi:MAG: oligosaccharide flippase family protein [Hyphomicrobiaceae bacterium]
MAGTNAALDEGSDRTGAAILRGGSITMLGTLSGGALAFVAEVAIARTLGPSAYGLFSLAYVLVRIASSLSIAGLGAAVLHHIPVYLSKDRKAEAAGAAIFAPLVPVVIGTLAALLVFACSDLLAEGIFAKPESAPHFRMLAAVIPLMSTGELVALATRGFGHSIYHVLIASLWPPVVLLGGIGLVAMLGLPSTAVGGAVVTAYGSALIVGLVCIATLVRPILGSAKPRPELARLLAYAWPVLLATLLYNVVEWADILLVGYFLSAADVGVYRACAQILLVFNIVVYSINAGAAHLFPVLEGPEHARERNDAFRLVCLLVFAVSAPLFSIVALFHRSILALLGSGYAEGGLVLVSLAIGRLIRAGLGNTAFLLLFTGRQRVELGNAALGAFAIVALGATLIPWLGLYGAALASIACDTVLNLLRAYQVRRLMQVSVPITLLARMIAAVGAVALGLVAVLVLTDLYAKPLPPLMLVGLVLATGLLQIAALWCVGIAPADRQRIAGILEMSLRTVPPQSGARPPQ